ncbi:MAG: cardiolipin synthase [Planctomycetes bacterium]|nr:cardiolipin synthase [Planctomycetota bacterium]
MPTWSALYLASEWLIRFAMLVWVPQKRSPEAARAWLLFIFVLPWPGILAYAVLGRVHMPKRRVELQDRISARVRAAQAQARVALPATEPDLPARFREAVTLAKNLGGFDIVGGNAIELLDDYDGTIERLIADIDAAREHVHLLFYIFEDDGTGRRVADALMRAAGRGVRCRILMDDVGGRSGLERLGPRLQAAGIELNATLPVGVFRRKAARFDLRNHRKVVVIDGRIGYIGSQNIVDASSWPGLVNEEMVARIEGPVVAQLQIVFLADRYVEVETPLEGSDLFPPPESKGDVPALLFASGPGHGGARVGRLLVALIHAARHRLVVTTPYFVPPIPFLEAIETAVQRGVEVHLVVSKKTNRSIVDLAQRSYYEELLDAGIRIWLYRPRFLHAKHVTIDDAVAVVGSTNVDHRSFELNQETSLIVYDARIVAWLRAVQERYFASSDPLDAAAWSRRPLCRKVVQNTARLADAFL